MFLKVGVLSLGLLLASRFLGLLRESVQAAAFGTSGLADVAVLMLTFPDWVTGVLVSGALAYVLLPHWVRQVPILKAQSQRRVANGLLVLGGAISLVLWLLRNQVVGVLAQGLPSHLLAQAAQGIVWSAVALPAALLAALWVTRLQHEQDFVGFYAANLAVNAVLIVALYGVVKGVFSIGTVTTLGVALVWAMGLRLAWLKHRLRRFSIVGIESPHTTSVPVPQPLPRVSLWLWAALSSGLPLTLPFVVRTFASGTGEGALATFNYAWKLVELPLVLAIQLVATLAFPAITRAMVVPSSGIDNHQALELPAQAVRAVRSAFALAWMLACAAVVALQVGASAFTTILFGWGRMEPEGLAAVAAWGTVASWGLLPQALIAVALTVLAVLGKMRIAAIAYSAALVVLLASGLLGGRHGAWLMGLLNMVLVGVAVVVLWGLSRFSIGQFLLPWRTMVAPAATMLGLSVVAHFAKVSGIEHNGILTLSCAALAAMLVVAVGCLTSAELRMALQR